MQYSLCVDIAIYLPKREYGWVVKLRDTSEAELRPKYNPRLLSVKHLSWQGVRRDKTGYTTTPCVYYPLEVRRGEYILVRIDITGHATTVYYPLEVRRGEYWSEYI